MNNALIKQICLIDDDLNDSDWKIHTEWVTPGLLNNACNN